MEDSGVLGTLGMRVEWSAGVGLGDAAHDRGNFPKKILFNYPKQSIDSKQSLYCGIFRRTRTNNFTLCMETHKRPQIVKAILRKKNGTSSWERRMEVRTNQPSWLQTILQSYSHQDSMVQHKDRNIDQWNKIESPEINPRAYGHLIFDKEGKHIQWRKDNLFNKWCWENWSTKYKRMKLEHFLTPYIKEAQNGLKI